MKLIDGNKIVMSLADWWYSSFGQEETEESKAIKKVMDQVEKMVMEMPEIVRCKDCRHRDLFSCPLVDNDFQKDEDFCSWGECKEEKQVTGKLNNPDDSLLTEDVEACKEQKSKLDTDLISRQAAIEAMAPFDTNHELRDTLESLPPVTPTEQNEGDILKFYYVESLDEYWIGQRCGTRYYGKWTGNCFTYGYSRYLPWGEHVVAPDTLWKEYTYPSEPKEIPFNEWLTGFLEKEALNGRPKGEWIGEGDGYADGGIVYDTWYCSKCDHCEEGEELALPNYCPNCGADMRGNKE